VFTLRREADVGHHGNACLHHGPDSRRVVFAALDLDGVRQSFLQEPHARGYGLLGGNLVASERQVRHNEGAPGRAGNCPAQGQQFLHGDRKAGLVAEDIVGRGVAHQEHLDAGGVEDFRRVLLVRGEHREFGALVLGLLQVVEAHLGRLPLRGRRNALPGPAAIGGGDVGGHA
jgi:hypothetical protein